MKTHKFIVGLLCIMFITNSFVNGQYMDASIVFDKTEHNFGTINEEDGKASYKFEFSNTGNKALIIQNVRASCGCTRPEWTKEPVKAGEKGYINVAYNPKGRPGKFRKQITVFCNSPESPVKLYITGEVKQNKSKLETLYPKAMGSLRMKTQHVSFGKIYNNQQYERKLEIVNAGKEPITVSSVDVPDYISLKIEPQILAPNQKGMITITYDATKVADWGYNIKYIYLSIDGNKSRSYHLDISALIEEDFSKLTKEELENAPVIEFENKSFNFGTITEGDVIEHEFVFKNTGKRDLIIRKTKASCGCTAVNTSENTIAPGKTGTIKARFNSKHRKGRQSKTITVISNDPKNHKVTLWLKGTIEPKAQ